MRLQFAVGLLIGLIGSSAWGVDHAGFDALLKKHVDAEGLVDYRALARDAAALDTYLAQLAEVDLQALPRDAQLALLMNAYNAFTLRLMLDHPDVASIKDIPEDQRWKGVRWKLAGKLVSLDQIEHEIIRPGYDEPRIHFALVCAAVACPPLRAEAYVAERLDEQLDDQMKFSHAGDRRARWVVYTPGADSIKLTKLYQWYGKDFAPDQAGVLQYLTKYVPGLEPQKIRNVEWLDYDWALNSQENRSKLP